MASNGKVKVATCSLAGCFGCHMSLLDIDEKLLKLIELIQFDKSPIDDIKEFTGPVDVGLIEGAVCNSENVHVLREFRKHCKYLVAVGECGITGGLPSMRNGVPLQECLEEAYVKGVGVKDGFIPSDTEIPLLLDKVHPLHEVVKVDFVIPGCPPSAEALWYFLSELLAGRDPSLPVELIRYD